jgi:glycosyltransferase involved in cell wall biosynthesis
VLDHSRPLIAVDGVFFQYLSTGISRVWSALFDEWSKTGFIDHVVFLARPGDNRPNCPAVRCVEIPAHAYDRTGEVSIELERVCRNLGIDLFVSTYYTSPIGTPSFFFGYDMIPEMRGLDLTREMWREKRRAILHGAAHVMISENSARDLERIYQLPAGSTYVAHCGIWKSFYKPEPDEIATFRSKYALGGHPYVLLVGDRVGVGGYKNAKLAFEAIGKMADQKRFTIVCVGGALLIEQELRASVPNGRIMRLTLDDEELRAAYGGAYAFLYPSRYEGFGMPVLEAIACGAPVITCRNSSISEVAGDAAIFVGEDDAEGMCAAIESLSDPALRGALGSRGAIQAAKFTFKAMADEVARALLDTHRRLSSGELNRPSAVWEDLRETLKSAQEPQYLFRALRREFRRRLILVAKKIGINPGRNRFWAKVRQIQLGFRLNN